MNVTFYEVVTARLSFNKLCQVASALLSPKASRFKRMSLTDLWRELHQDVVGDEGSGPVGVRGASTGDDGTIGELPDNREAQAETLTKAYVISVLKASSVDVSELNRIRAAQKFCPLNLSGINLSGKDLRGADFTNCILAKTDLRNCDLRGANFDDAIIKQARIAGATFDDETFRSHEIEDFLDGHEVLDFQRWLSQASYETVRGLLSISEVSLVSKRRKRHIQWQVILRNNIRTSLKVRIWADNGKYCDELAEALITGNGTHRCSIETDRERFPIGSNTKIRIHIEGYGKPIREFVLPEQVRF